MLNSKSAYIVGAVSFLFFLSLFSCNSGNNNSSNSEKERTLSDSFSAKQASPKARRNLSLCTIVYSASQNQKLENVSALLAAYQNVRDSNAFRLGKSKYAVYLNESRWRKKVLNVVFIGGDSIVKNRLMKTASEWEHFSNIKLNFNPKTKDTDISISFYPKSGTKSCVGIYSKGVVPSMNYDDLRPDDDEYYYRYYVLHEFGHALGLMHEHQSPNSNVVWNIPALLKYCGGYDPPWDSLMVQHQIIDQFSREEVTATDFDPTSIMMYSFPASLVISGTVPEYGNSVISKLDSIHIRKIYPF